MNIDRMTAKERMKCLLLNRPIDRVPFMPFAVGWYAINCGMSLEDFYANPGLAFRAGKQAMKAYPWANIRPVYGWGDHGAWEFGGKIRWPKGNLTMTPYTSEPLFDNPEDVDHLAIPDPLNTDWFRLRDQFNKICVQEGFSAHLPSGSIMAQLGSILGIENLMRWMWRYPGAVSSLAEKVLNFSIQVAKITIERYGAKHCSVMTDLTVESNSVISPEMFEEFCLPYIKRLHGLYLECGVRSVMIHLCGDHRRNLVYWKCVPLPKRTIFSIGDGMDLEETGNILGEEHILAGNMATTTLQVGTEEDVKEEVKRCLRQAKARPGGFILMPACEYPPMAPPENFEAIKEALMEHGFY